jgi:trehalose/maltose hydrolase-like predicted phosphorylase
MAGIYNRFKEYHRRSTIENESVGQYPQLVASDVPYRGWDWFDLQKVDLLEYRVELDIRKACCSGPLDLLTGKDGIRGLPSGVLSISIICNWPGGDNHSPRKLVGNALRIRSAIDGRVENTLVKRYCQHQQPPSNQLGTGISGDEIIWLQVEDQTIPYQDCRGRQDQGLPERPVIDIDRDTIQESGYIGQEFVINVSDGELVAVEKIAALYNSRDPAISESLLEAEDEVRHAEDFAELLNRHVLGWNHLWDLWSITLKTESSRMGANPQSASIPIFYKLFRPTPSPGCRVPPRGLNGEAYTGPHYVG